MSVKLNGSTKWVAAIITLAIFVATGIYGYGALNQTVKTESETNNKQDETIEEIKEKNSKQDLALREFSTKQERMHTDVKAQNEDIKKIGVAVLKISNKLGVE